MLFSVTCFIAECVDMHASNIQVCAVDVGNKNPTVTDGINALHVVYSSIITCILL